MNFVRKIKLLRELASHRHGALGQVVRGVSDYLLEPEHTQGSPFFLQIEPTILCNLECKFCINPFLQRTRTSLSLERFRAMVDQLPNLAKISLVGIGESFMNKDLWRIIREAKSRGITIGTTTNGTILTERILHDIFDSGLDWLNFSLDGATKATYEKMRPGAVFEEVLANIRRIVTAAHGHPCPALAVWFLATRENITELPQMVGIVKELGIASLNTQGVHYWGHQDWHEKASQANAIGDLGAVLRSTRRLAEAAGVRFQWYNFPDPRRQRGCKWPWKGAYVTAEGFVTPCCENGSDPSRSNFGNVFERPFAELWNSEGYRQFRRELRSRTSRPAICVDCPSYHKPMRLGT